MKQLADLIQIVLFRMIWLEKKGIQLYEQEVTDLISCLTRLNEALVEAKNGLTREKIQNLDVAAVVYYVKSIPLKTAPISANTYKISVYHVDRVGKALQSLMISYSTCDFFLGYKSEQDIIDELSNKLQDVIDALTELIAVYDLTGESFTNPKNISQEQYNKGIRPKEIIL